MRKILRMVLILAVGTLLLTGCGNTASDNAMEDANGNFQRGPGDYAQQNNADLYGEVKSVSGNNITLALLEMPQRRQLTEEERQQMRERLNENTNSDGDSQNNADNNAQYRNGNAQDNSGSGNSSNNGGQRNRQGPGGGIGREKKYTGQNETITVSSETSITTFDRTNGNFEEKELKLSDIQAGETIQVWYKQDDGGKKEVERIRVMPVQN